MMFGRSHEDATTVLPPMNLSGGRTTAISILPGVPLPPGLVQPAPEPAHLAAPEERELVTAGAPPLEAAAASGFLAPPAPGTSVGGPAPAEAEPAKRSSFFGLRRRGKNEAEDPSS